MKQEEVLEYNKRCAEFLGNKTQPKIKDWHIYITPIGSVSYDKMLFHSDWNWIMAMVKAIQGKFYAVDIYTSSCMCVVKGYNTITKNPHISVCSDDIQEAVVQAINQFLIWYNSRGME